ncbi:MAG: hypothetical protein QM661_08685, partial [Solimonas sp.]
GARRLAPLLTTDKSGGITEGSDNTDRGELETLAELRTMIAQKLKMPDDNVKIVPAGKKGYKVELLFSTEYAARSTFEG